MLYVGNYDDDRLIILTTSGTEIAVVNLGGGFLGVPGLVPVRNNAPVAVNDLYSVNEDQSLNVAAPGVLANDSDVDDNPLTAVLVSGPSNGMLTLNSNGSFTYTPNTNFSGTDSFTYKANDGNLDSNVATVTITVNPSGNELTSLGPAKIWVGLTNSDDVGIRFDLRAEVYRNGTQLVGSGEVSSVPGGSCGFNNANLHTINLAPAAGVSFSSGDALSINVYVRNACSGSGKNSGRARLWYNDTAANSRFDAAIGGPATYYLLNGSLLGTAAGPGPKKTIDIAAGAKCSPFKLFGIWSTTF